MKTIVTLSILAGLAGFGAVVAGCGNNNDSGVDATNGKAISDLDIGGDVTIATGEAKQLTATVKYADGTSLDVTSSTDLTWNIGNTSVATIDKNGVTTGVAVGTTTVKATFQARESASHQLIVH